MLVMVGSALVIDGRAMADFRVRRDLVHGAVVVPHHQGDFDPIADFQGPGEPGQRKVIVARRQSNFGFGRQHPVGGGRTARGAE